MRAALDDLRATATGRRVAVLGDMLELGPDELRFHAEIGAHAGESRRRRPHRRRPARGAHGRALRRRDARRRRRRGRGGARRRARAARRHGARQGVAGRGPRGRRRRACARRRARDGRGPDRRHRGAADLHLPVAEVHRVPAPPRVRPVHPRGGARGPPRQGRHADDGRDHHLHGDLDPVPHAVGLRLAVGRGLRRGDALRAAGLRRRLHQDRPAPLARDQRADEARRDDPHLDRAVVGRDAEGGPAADAAPARRRLPGRPQLPGRHPVPHRHLHRRRGHDERGQPHRRPRRPRGGVRRDRAADATSGSRSSRPASTTSRCCRAASSGRASGSSGTTRSRRRSSWATRDRSGSAARSRGSRS